MHLGAGDVQNDGQRGQDADGHRGQAAGLVRDRLLVAANAALASLAGNADTHFAMVNEGAAPALVAPLQHGTLPCHCALHACQSVMPLLLSFKNCLERQQQQIYNTWVETHDRTQSGFGRKV